MVPVEPEEKTLLDGVAEVVDGDPERLAKLALPLTKRLVIFADSLPNGSERNPVWMLLQLVIRRVRGDRQREVAEFLLGIVLKDLPGEGQPPSSGWLGLFEMVIRNRSEIDHLPFRLKLISAMQALLRNPRYLRSRIVTEGLVQLLRVQEKATTVAYTTEEWKPRRPFPGSTYKERQE